jgi:hypothetical protein
MNEVREVIERVGARFDPPGGGFDDLSRRRKQARVRRRLTAGALALAVAAGGSLLVVRALPASTPGAPSKVRVLATWAAATSATPRAALSSQPTCPTPSGDDPPAMVLSSTSGAAGSSIDVSGTFVTEELWMQLWWNAGEISGDIAPPPWPPTGPNLQFAPAGPGPVAKLESIAGPGSTGDCSFQTTFTVPGVEPGIYQVQWVYGLEAHAARAWSEGAFGLLTSLLTFEVTG